MAKEFLDVAVNMPSLFPLHSGISMTSSVEKLISIILMRCVGDFYAYCGGPALLRGPPLIRQDCCQTASLTSHSSGALVVCSLEKVRCRLLSSQRLGDMTVTVDPCGLRALCVGGKWLGVWVTSALLQTDKKFNFQSRRSESLVRG